CYVLFVIMKRLEPDPHGEAAQTPVCKPAPTSDRGDSTQDDRSPKQTFRARVNSTSCVERTIVLSVKPFRRANFSPSVKQRQPATNGVAKRLTAHRHCAEVWRVDKIMTFVRR